MGKNALVLGGGGAKGAYEAGVLKALKKLNYKYDIVTGTSVGSINGAAAAQGDISLAEKVWLKLTTNDVLDLKEELPSDLSEAYKVIAKEFTETNGFSYTNLEKLLREVIDEQKLRNSPTDFGLVTVKFPTMRSVHKFKSEMEKGKIVDYILGSAAFFPAMKPHKIGSSLYIDGGYNDNLPINMAIKKGATNIVAVNLNAVGLIKKPDSKNVSITYIDSFSNLGNILIFNKERAKINIRLGYLDTFKAFGHYEGYKYTFKNKELSKFFISNYPKISEFIMKFTENDLNIYKSLIKQSAYSAFMAKYKNKIAPSKEAYMTLILENLMEIFSLPATEVYTYKKALSLIKKNFNAIDNLEFSRLDEILNEIKINKEFLKYAEEIQNILKDIDRPKIVRYIYDLLTNEAIGRGIILLLMLCAPKEFYSSLLLYLN